MCYMLWSFSWLLTGIQIHVDTHKYVSKLNIINLRACKFYNLVFNFCVALSGAFFFYCIFHKSTWHVEYTPKTIRANENKIHSN